MCGHHSVPYHVCPSHQISRPSQMCHLSPDANHHTSSPQSHSDRERLSTSTEKRGSSIQIHKSWSETSLAVSVRLLTPDSMCQSFQVHPQTKGLVVTSYRWAVSQDIFEFSQVKNTLCEFDRFSIGAFICILTQIFLKKKD